MLLYVISECECIRGRSGGLKSKDKIEIKWNKAKVIIFLIKEITM